MISSLINHKDNIPYYLCKYDYYLIVDYLCKIENFDVNYVYTIFKPSYEQNDIVYRIKIKNKDIILKTEEEEIILRMYGRLLSIYKNIQDEKKISTYMIMMK